VVGPNETAELTVRDEDYQGLLRRPLRATPCIPRGSPSTYADDTSPRRRPEHFSSSSTI